MSVSSSVARIFRREGGLKMIGRWDEEAQHYEGRAQAYQGGG